MSFLFSGLLRLNVQSTVRFDNAEVNLQETFTLKSEQLTVRLAQPQVGEQDNEIEICKFTKNQHLVANKHKKVLFRKCNTFFAQSGILVQTKLRSPDSS